jgi:hypothetical protein
VEDVKGKARWKRCKFVIGEIDFDEVYIAFDIIKLLDVSLAL